MKKLFTLFALLMCFIGAKAEWLVDYTIDYSRYSGFPFYVMGYVPSFDGTAMIDAPTTKRLWREGESGFPGEDACESQVTINGSLFYVQETGTDYWRQYFMADDIPTKLDGRYKVVAKVKASEACTINVNMLWSWGESPASASVDIPQSDDFVEVEWEYSGINGQSCSLIAQPGTVTATIEWQSVTVYEWQKAPTKPTEWIEDIVNGDAETPWTEEQAATSYDDMDNNFTICAWSKEKGHNMNEEGYAWNPFPASIVVDPYDENNHVFLCDGQQATTEGDASAWDNQFWIQSQHAWKSGLTLKIKFRYMASQECKANTQIHKQSPGDYLVWHAIGDINFTPEWQTFENTTTIADDMNGGWSIAFNLNSEVKDAVKFYFDDLSWQYMKLDEGYFISGINKNVTLSYDDLADAIEFTPDGGWGFVATIGEKGNKDSYVDQVMISTTRGDDQAFKGATLKPYDKIKNDPEDWRDYSPSTNAKIDLPGLGVWKVYLDTQYEAMAFEMLEGTPYEEPEPVAIYTNADEIVVNAWEREYTESEAEAIGIDKPENPGQIWDNQFFIKANRTLNVGEVTVIKFLYKANKAAKTSTQLHGAPGAYIHWAAIGDVNFEEDWQMFEKVYTIPSEADGKDAQSIAFNMAEIKDACDYYIKDVQWYLYDESLEEGQTYENLIDQRGTANFYVKQGAGNAVYQYEGGSSADIVWTIAGSSETIFGSYWDPTDTRNDMSYEKDGMYVLKKENVKLEAGTLYEYKVVGNHSWEINYGANGERDGWNMEFTVNKTGRYNLYFYFYPDWNHQLEVVTNYITPGELVEDYFINYADYKGFPFYVMGYVPEFDNKYMSDFGSMYKYVTLDNEEGESSDVIVKTQSDVEYYKIALNEPLWHQYIIADGIPTELGGNYTVRAKVRASEPCSINVNMGWGWGDGQQIETTVYLDTEWQEVEWSYSNIGGSSCFLVAQPGAFAGTIEWQHLSVSHMAAKPHEVEWIDYLANGDAEKSWEELGLADVKYDDAENNYKVSAWGRVKGQNITYDSQRDMENWCPFPATIEVDPSDASNHVFVVHAALADTERTETEDPSAWDNQFWIQSTQEWKAGDQVKVHFRYKASQPARTNTQVHKQAPMDYLMWHAIGDIDFTTEWQEFDGTMYVAEDMAGTWSIAFNLNAVEKEPIDFYFDDLSWQAVKTIEINPNPTLVVVHGQERDDLTDDNGFGQYELREEEGGTGNVYDNQFFIVANRPLNAYERTVVSFDYKASKEAETYTECHAQPTEYLDWNSIGNVSFTEEWQHFETVLTVPEAADGMQTIAFDMAVLREANDYSIKNFVWKYADNTETLIDQTGSANFFVREGVGTEYKPAVPCIDVPTALEIAGALAAGEATEEYYHIGGVVTDIKEISATYGNTTFYMASPENPEQSLYVYRSYGLNGEKITNENLFKVGDEIYFYGQLMNYKGTTLETKQGGYLLSVNHKLTVDEILAQLQEQIAITEDSIAHLAYANVPGVTELKALVADAKAATAETAVDVLKKFIKDLNTETMNVVSMDKTYRQLEALMVRIELAIQNNPDADANLVAEATAKVADARTALNSGAYSYDDVWNMIYLMNDYLNALSKVYLTINVPEAGKLATIIAELGFEPSNIMGLTLSGSLNSNDMYYIHDNMRGISKLDMGETDVQEILGYQFYNLYNLNKLVLPKYLERLDYYAFSYCYSLTEVELPSTLQYIGNYAFADCFSLKSITYNCIIPPYLYDPIIGGDYDYQCTLNVPSMAVNVYKNASYWQNFQIVGTDMKPENILVTRDAELDWPEVADYKPNVSIERALNDDWTYGHLTINGNSTVSLNSLNLDWNANLSSRYGNYNDIIGDYDSYRNFYSTLLANTPMRADNVAVTLDTYAYRWNFISFPFDVKVSDIANLTQTNAPLVIRRYDGKNRADGKMGETWVDMTSESVLEAGKGYIWQCASGDEQVYQNVYVVPAQDNDKKNNIFASDDVTVELNEFASEFSQNRSWNLIGNPYPTFFDVRALNTAAPITVWNGYNRVYQAIMPSEDPYILNPGQAFFIQRPFDQPTITFLKEGRQHNLDVRQEMNENAGRRAAKSERFVFNLILSGSEEAQGDRTRIVFDTTAKMDYEAGRDASKFMSPEAAAVQIYTTDRNLHFAINERPLMDGIVELGLSIGKAGSYTIALSTKVEGEVYLIDRKTGSEIRLDGSMGYTFQAEQGVTEGRFAVRFGNGDVTGIRGIGNDNKNADNWYNLNGQRVNAPVKGLYIQNGKKTVVK